MKRLSIRWRLTLWYGGVLAAVLLVFSAAVYVIMRHHLLQQIDAGLSEELAELQEEVAEAGNRSTLAETLAGRFAEHENYEFQVSTVDGEVIFCSRALRGAPLPVNYQPSDSSQTLYQSLALPKYANRWRTATRHVSVPAGRLRIQAAWSLAYFDHELRELFAVLLVTGPLAVLAALGGGYVLARRALAPVDRMTRTASAITAQKLDERLEVSGADDELARLAETLNDMIARLERSFHETQRFTADAAHELRTPLTVIRNEAEVALRSDRSAEDYRRALENLLEETNRLAHIADQLLFLCREDAGLQPARWKTLDMGDLAREVTGHMQALAEEKGVKLTITQNADCSIHGDQDRLRRLLFNLLENAIRYTPPDGEVTVGCHTQDGEVEIAIGDTGPGIPAEHLPHIFERFYQVEASRSNEEDGSGLGLSICKAIVEAYRGTIDVQSTVGEGTNVAVRLPQNR